MYIIKNFFFFLFFCFTQMLIAQTTADRVFKNAKIYTANDNQPFAEAIAIQGDSIIFVGSNNDVDSFIGANTLIHDVNNKLILPGFHDVHIHPLEAGSPVGASCILDADEDDPELLGEALYDCNPSSNPNGWVLAWGHSIFTLLDATRPPKEILDDYFPDTPVAVMEETSHSIWVNSKALETLGIDSNTPDPIGGHIVKDPITGTPNGILLDNAGDGVLALALAPNTAIDNSNYNGLVNYSLPLLAQNGITSICEARTYWKRNYINIWKQIKDNDLLTVRIVLGLWAYPDDDDSELIPALQNLYDEGDDFLRIHQIKLYSDGITINATAALHEPYEYNLDLPFDSGLNYIEVNRLANLITVLEQNGFDFHIHAIGDRGITESLNAIETARNTNGDLGARHRITHLEIVDPLDYARFAQLDVIADVQVTGEFTQPDHWHDKDFLIGADRAENLIPLKSLFDAGAKITLSSDWDVSDLTPFTGIQNSVTRTPQELPSVEEAVKAYTIHGAYTMRQEAITGSLEVGKLADLICVDQDIFTIPTNQIKQTKVLLTLLGGEEIYKSNDFPTSANKLLSTKGVGIKLLPNVTSDISILKFSGGDTQTLDITIFNAKGIQVFQKQHVHNTASTSFEIHLENFSEGIFYIKIKSVEQDWEAAKKLIISR